MAIDQGPVVQSALLRAELIRLRHEKGATQDAVAKALEWSISKLIRIEGGKNPISRTDLQALLLHYGVTSPTRQEELQDLAKGARAGAWWDGYRGRIDDVYLGYVGLEAGAAVIRHFHGAYVPGLLQSREYAEVVTAAAIEPIDTEAVIGLRLQRMPELMSRADPPELAFVLDEAVIRRHVGIKVNRAIMPRQLEHIAKTVEENDRITVQVIPFEAGAHQGLRGPFTLLQFNGGLSDALFLEGARDVSVIALGGDSRIPEYQDAFVTLRDEALSPEESLRLLREVAASMS